MLALDFPHEELGLQYASADFEMFIRYLSTGLLWKHKIAKGGTVWTLYTFFNLKISCTIQIVFVT